MRDIIFNVVDLKCEYQKNPIGIDRNKMRLSWKIEAYCRGWRQSAYQIVAASTKESIRSEKYDLWDSGVVNSGQSTNIEYAGKNLTSRQFCFWKVKVWDLQGNEAESSERAFWEMGLLHTDDWQGRWIGMGSRYLPGWAPLLRREFVCEKDVKYARAYICGLGYYELYINGQKVGDHVLDPAQTDYEERVMYVTYDITEYLRNTTNAVGIILGDGWYHQNRVWIPEMIYGQPRVIFQFYAEYMDGSCASMYSDEKWKASYSPIVLNNVYAGETYDARLEQPGWEQAGFNDSRWFQAEIMEQPGGRLTAQIIPPVKKNKIIEPVGITEPSKGVYIFDMGVNMAGWVKLTVQGNMASEVVLRYAEVLDRNTGMIDTDSGDPTATFVVQTDRYISRGPGKESWEPRFTYHGFRYVEMTGYPGKPTIDAIKGIKVYTAVEECGSFECSDEMLNKLHEVVKNTVASNMHSIPTDCPIREKCGWTGDAMIIADMVMYNWDSAAFWQKYVDDMKTSRKVYGEWKNIVPGRRTCGEAAPAWTTALVQIPWYLYTFYGDKGILDEYFDDMKAWVYHLAARAERFIVSFGTDDWCAPGTDFFKGPTLSQISTACYYLCTALTAKAAGITGRTADADELERLASDIKKSFIDKFFNEDKGTYGNQAVDSFALHLGLVPEGREKCVAFSIAANIEKNEFHLTTGHIGTKYVFKALIENGYNDLTMRIFHQTTYPSFGYQLERGASTLWETWEGDADFSHPNKGSSLNHPFKGGFDAWLFSHILGIRPDSPGFKDIIIKPYTLGQLHYAKGYYDSLYGRIAEEWCINNGYFTLKVQIPANTSAKIFLPVDDVKKLLEGDHRITESGGIQIIGFENDFIVVSVGSGTYEFKTESQILY